METPIFFFPKKFEIQILTKSWNHLSIVNIGPTLVIDTSMERSSRVLQHGNIKIWFKKNSKLNFDLCQRAEIIQVGLNMHLYDNIGDASSSLRGSTSSFELVFKLLANNRKIFKRIPSFQFQYWSNFNAFYFNGFVSTSSVNWWKFFIKFRNHFLNWLQFSFK